ncbi:enoyl-CoA hydratase/isomerase family protein [Robertmurraya massiliosenegalensis]|uniref:enoyl-CoA hydratase/isomerase family protein n=1 Tax=Robertmurraya TaxID=2837507 RepID=UPI0039A45C96
MSKSYDIHARENGILSFTITRPEKRNAVNFEVMDGLKEALQLARTSNIKALVLTGEGDEAFCSGGDLSQFHELRTVEQAYQMLSKMGELLYELMMLPKPTIALINGVAIGGGCEIAAACDFRIAKKGVKAGFVQGKLAITTGWGGGTILLERIPHAMGMKMLFEAKLFEFEELLDLGFVQYIYEGDRWEGLRDHFGSTLNMEGTVLTAYKEILIRKWKKVALKERIEHEVRQCSELWEKEAHHKQVEKFLNRKN